MDALWLEAITALQQVSGQADRLVGHPEFAVAIPGIVAYAATAGLDPDRIDAVAIHKGDYSGLDPAFLARFLVRGHPVAANAVFIILGVRGDRLPPSNPHIGALRAIQQWVVDQVSPELAAPFVVPSLTDDAALDRMVRFLARHLTKPIDPANPQSPLAVAETAQRFDDTAWFWIDDAGKAAELFAAPAIRNAYPAEAEAMLNHVLRLSPDRIMHRRSAVPEMHLIDDSPEAFSAFNCFFRLTGDLVNGAVRPAIRFNDGRTRFIGEFAGNSLEFVYGMRPHAVDVESCITGWSIERQDHACVFAHTSTIRGRALVGEARDLAELTFRYTFHADRPHIDMVVDLAVRPGVRLHNVRLGTGIDQLSFGGNFDELRVGQAGTYHTFAVPTDQRADLHAGPADYLGINEAHFSPLSLNAGIPGFAHGFHVRYHDGARIERIAAWGSREGRFHWVRTFYRLGTVGSGQSRTIREARLMTGGGYYGAPDIYAALLDAPPSPHEALDPAMSYDIGAELNAVAVTLLFARAGRYADPPDAARMAELKSWFDRHLQVYRWSLDSYGDEAGEHVFLRGLAFVILALDAMARAFPEETYQDQLVHCLTILCDRETPVAGADDESLFHGELDCHCTTLLAIARGAAYAADTYELAQQVRSALRAIKIGHVPSALFGSHGPDFFSLYVRPRAGQSAQDAGFWVFKLGLALRAFNALNQAHAAGHLTLDAETMAWMGQLTEAALTGLRDAARANGDELEILTSLRSGETNSETQPWAALGLVPVIEYELFGRPGMSAPGVPAPPRRLAVAKVPDHVLPLTLDLTRAKVAARLEGFAGHEAIGRWTDGRRARIVLGGRARWPQAVEIAITAAPFVAPDSGPQTIAIHVNGQCHLTAALPVHRHQEVFRIALTLDESTRQRPLEILFEVDNPQQPARLGEGDDERELGLLVSTITVSAMPVITGNPYLGLPDAQYWRRSISAVETHRIDPVSTPRFTISPQAKVGTAGSCFAQHIARQISKSGCNYFVTETGEQLDPAARAAANYGTFSARYGNVYTAVQLLQLFEEAFGERTPAEAAWQRPDGRWVDPCRQQVEPAGFASAEAVAEDRARHLAAVRRLFCEVDVLVFTLGLTEAWRSRHDGSVFSAAPGVVADAFDPARHEFVNFSVEETTAALCTFLTRLHACNPGAKVLLTVSPIPLIATYEPRSVLVSTCLSKAVLRVAAEAAINRFDWVDYFPSYEIITGSFAGGLYFEPDWREVNMRGVGHVMRCFSRHYLAAPPQPAAPQIARDAPGDAIICDEEVLDGVRF